MNGKGTKIMQFQVKPAAVEASYFRKMAGYIGKNSALEKS